MSSSAVDGVGADELAQDGYISVGDEVDVFVAAWRSQLPVMLKGPTGCGKTRLVEHVAELLDIPLYTVCCHEDLTASDLLGRFVLQDSNTEWVDGPLTRAVREGAICYLDEIVEARQDAIVSIHSLTDHRRELQIERLGGLRIAAAAGFQLVVSYNPGYQSMLKDLKMSTRQRLVGIDLGFPPARVERQILRQHSDLDHQSIEAILQLGQAIRRLDDAGLRESASTRALIATARLVRNGLSLRSAALAAMVSPLTDEATASASLTSLIDSYIG
ncbi:CbbQ/NirQ/NorQ/GpvN family protein [Mycolicibacterium pulveris]|uniref:CbbQ/NirQ/NorQ/GpvN family protein n=1 Tax=Mycolicibacterium pulveris TaxID=36813 RepID=A0A7I7UPM8_MYCPV|nr:CbbQ/NirQ/NorQ/GpvN family protein [Mycolicibacterium pulveris]MCV6983555.1 CbbQ/NirQ/NorQ/GpvN family protein [Mycolicibacterium pulveris]BBY83434.1 CbbQ/NirQ/NorQ/GpvN family protein [Mycolicibacterium pulveris]